MMVDELIAVLVPSRSPSFSYFFTLGETSIPKQRCSGCVWVVVRTTFCLMPVSFCVKTFIRSPK